MLGGICSAVSTEIPKGLVEVANKYPESEDDFVRMQQEAIRRVREMQNRARATLENAGMHIENSEPRQSPSPPAYSAPAAGEAPSKTVQQRHEHEKQESKSSFTEEKHVPHHSVKPLIRVPSFNFSLDSDQVLLTLLIYLLLKDGADKWLILSLAYVLM